MHLRLILFLAGCAIAAPSLGANQFTPTGFTVRLDVTVQAPPAKVYQALLGQVSEWWDSAHTYSQDSKNLTIDARPGGCFCERLADGGGVEHMRIIFVKPFELVRMAGGLGPLQGSGLAGAMTWKLSPAGTGTKLELLYNVGGSMDGGFDKIAPMVEGMLTGQVQRLKVFAETGYPVAK